MQTRGFTLIEVMISLALAMMVILITAATFRMASQAIARARAMSVENRMLRLGMTLAIDDADYWRSYGDPRLPYDKAFMQEQNPSLVSGNAPRIAPMRRVTFSKSTAVNDVSTTGYDNTARLTPGSRTTEAAYGKLVNPNALLIHDPRAWYRGHHYNDADPNFAFVDDKSSAGPVAWPFSKLRGSSPYQATPWGPGQLWGPYHLVANTDMSDSDHAPTSVQQRQIAMARPNLQHRLFQRLGEFGMLMYMPKGTPISTSDRNGYPPDFNSVPTHPRQTTDLKNYRVGYQLRTTSRYANSTYGARWASGLMDAEQYTCLLGFAPESSGWETRAQTLFFDPTDYPSREVINEPYTAVHNNERGDRAWYKQAGLTVHLPFNRSTRMGGFASSGMDRASLNSQARSLDYLTKPDDAPILSTTSLRFNKLKGSDLALQRVMVDNVETGQLIMITFSALGTTYRGARQHYRVAGEALGYDMGDWYE
ncbi:MAG: prepilin-type N-terminal cleavage/methylation domain-containing protein [Planctomycetota bacterium]|jgi:type II secretory pathway pseudopilin PulG|nr:prepilin-type N-terminal cleavage/methylation domain-containing protein [Planctomycetota bacterium]